MTKVVAIRAALRQNHGQVARPRTHDLGQLVHGERGAAHTTAAPLTVGAAMPARLHHGTVTHA